MAQVEISFGTSTVRLEASGVKDVFKAFTQYEVLSESECGACGSHDVVPRHRVAQGYDFYSFNCLACRAELHLGQYKDKDGLFPKRKDQAGNWLNNKGWVKWEGQQQTQSQHTQPPQASPF